MPKTADKFLPEKYKVAIHGENSMSAKRTSNVSTEITSPELFRTHKKRNRQTRGGTPCFRKGSLELNMAAVSSDL